jgi:hypothetical protein
MSTTTVGLEHRVGVGERVGQDQAALRVGVQHLDGAARRSA